MSIIVSNAFSPSMLMYPEQAVTFRLQSSEAVAAMLQAADSFESCVGHPDTARALSTLLSVDIPYRRVNVTLGLGTRLVLAQYVGPRRPAGATGLPDNARFKFWYVECVSIND